MNRATVNPIPASAETPRICRRFTEPGRRPTPKRTARVIASVIPTVLPTMRATTIAHVTRLDAAARSASGPSRMPAFASANSGTMTKLAARCSGASTRWSTCRSSRDRAGVISPRTAPTSAALRPALTVQTQSTAKATGT
jgi:hypothetical protein